MKQQNKTPEKELNETEIAHLSDAQFKTLVIRKLKELIAYGNNIKEEMKITLSEIKKSLQGTNSERRKAGVQINNLEHKDKINIQPEQKEETRIQKKWGQYKKILGHCQTRQHLIIGKPEEKEEQEIKNLFEKIMKENFPNWAKETDV